jgi:hypothetical protein
LKQINGKYEKDGKEGVVSTVKIDKDFVANKHTIEKISLKK